MDAKQYYTELLKSAGVADDKLQVVMGVLGEESVTKKLDEDLLKPRLRQDEFSRKMDEVSATMKRNNEWYAKELITYEELQRAKADYEQKMAALGTDPNNPPGPKPTTHSVGDVVTKKELEEMLAKRDGSVITIVKNAVKFQGDHIQRFGKPMDVDALEKIAVENNLPLDQAYAKMIAPQLEAKTQADIDARIKAAKEEGAREFASTHKIPVDTKPREPHLIFDKSATASKPTESDLRNSFVDTWNSVPAGANT